MFLSDEFAGFGGGSKGFKPSRSSRGYPEVRDPAAEKPSGILNEKLDAASLRKLRQHYGPHIS